MATDAEIKIKVGFEPGEVPPEVFDRIVGMAEDFTGEFSEASNQLRQMREEADGVADAVQRAMNVARPGSLTESNLTDAFGSIDQASQFTSLGARAGQLSHDLSEVGNSLSELWQKFVDGTVPAAQMEAALTKGAASLREMDETRRALAQDLGSGQRGMVQIDNAAIQQSNAQIAELGNEIAEASRHIGEMKQQAADTAQAVRWLFEQAQQTGNRTLKESLLEAFGGGERVNEILSLRKGVAQLEAAMDLVPQKASEIASAVDEGTLSASEGIEKFSSLAQVFRRFSGVGNEISQAMASFEKVEGVDAVLNSFAEVRNRATEMQASLTGVVDGLQANTNEWRAYQAALDSSADGYTKANAAAQQAIAQNTALEQALQKVAPALSKHLQAVEDAARAYDGSNDAADAANAALREISTSLDADGQSIDTLTERVSAAYARRAAAAEQAADRESSASEKAQAAHERMTYAMQLATMSKHELLEESNRLRAALQAEAAAGNQAGYERLTQRMVELRKAMEESTRTASVNRIQWMQSAQTAAQMGESVTNVARGIANMSDAAKAGELNLVGMASSVMQLSLALKAGLGPIGWVMMAVQGLQMAWNAYARSKQTALEADRKIQQENIQQLEKLIARQKEIIANELDEEKDERVRALQKQTEAERAALASQQEAGERASQHRIAITREETRQRLAELERLAKSGALSEEQAEQEKQAANDRLRQVEANARTEGEKRREILLEYDRDTAQKELNLARELSSQYKQKWSSILRVVATDDSELLALKQKLKALEVEKGAEKKKFQEISDRYDKALSEEASSAAVYSNWNRYYKLQAEYQKEQDEHKQRLSDLDEQIARAKDEEARNSERYANSTEAAYQAAKGLPEFAGMERDEVLETIRTIQGKNKALQEQVSQAERTLEMRERALESEQSDAENSRELADLQERGIAAVREYQRSLSQAADHERELTSARQVEKETRDRVKRELDGIVGLTKTSGSYSERDARTTAEIYVADRQILQQRLAELREARRSAQSSGATAETIKQIDEKLKSTESQLTGLDQSVKEATVEVLRRLNVTKEGADIELVSTLSRHQSGLARNEQRIEERLNRLSRMTDRYGEALKGGDDAGAAELKTAIANERRSLLRLAKKLDQYTASGDMATAEVTRALSDNELQRQAVERMAGQRTPQARQPIQQTAAQRRPQQQMNQPVQQQPQQMQQTQHVDTSRVSQAASAMQQQADQMRQVVDRLNGTLNSVTQISQSMVRYMAQTNAQLAQHQTHLETLQRQIRVQAANNI